MCDIMMDVFQGTLVNSGTKEYTELLLCLSFSFCFVFTFLASQTTSEDVFSDDESLGFLFLGLKEAR